MLEKIYSAFVILVLSAVGVVFIWLVIDSQKPPINELTFYEYTIDYDDDKEEYDVCVDNNHWIIPENRVKIRPTTDESYIIIQQYSKRNCLIIFINLQQRRKIE